MKRTAWILIAIGFALQVLFDFGSFVLPSMAGTEGVAVYPSILQTIDEILYRFSPYIIFSITLLSTKYRPARETKVASIAVIIGVLCPLIAFAVAESGLVSIRAFRELFWPWRPIMQIAFFIGTIFVLQKVTNNDLPQSEQ